MAQEGIASQRLAGAGGGGRGGKGGADGETAPFNPLGNFDSKKAQAVAFEQVSKAAAESAATGKPMSVQEQGKLAERTYRAMEDSFATENTRRFTQQTVGTELRTVAANPAAYAASYGKALKVGLDEKTLAGMGFVAPAKATAPAAAPAAASQGTNVKPTAAPVSATAPQAPQPKPERAVGEGLQSFKQRLVAWDTNRMAYEDAVSKAAIRTQNETLRLQAVAARPGLAQMGTGLR